MHHGRFPGSWLPDVIMQVDKNPAVSENCLSEAGNFLKPIEKQ
jgi:hypothetical protein